jgi:hypothetical protein
MLLLLWSKMKVVEEDSGPYIAKFTSEEVNCRTRRIMGVLEVQDVVYTKVRVSQAGYMHRFMGKIKKVLRGVYDLRDVRISIQAFDPLNEIHEWIIAVGDIVKHLFSIPLDYKRAIFICIRQKHRILFLGQM